jgi:hypothetical protein
MSSMEPSDTTAPREFERHEREELAALVELLYWRNGVVPTARDLNEAFGYDLTDRQFKDYISNPKIKKYLVEERNVPLEAKARLTPTQLDYIRVMTDPMDMRPMSVKLKDLGIKYTDVSKWQLNPFFKQVVYEQGTRSFGGARGAVLRSLAVEAIGGNVRAQQMYLEMSGDYSVKSEVNVNTTVEVRNTINVVIDVLQRHIPPELLEIIALELESVTVPGLPSASPIANGIMHQPTLQEPRRIIEALATPKRPARQPEEAEPL